MTLAAWAGTLAGCAVPTPDLLAERQATFFKGDPATAADPLASLAGGANAELARLVEAATRQNPGLAAVQERRKAAEAAGMSSLLRLLPSGAVQGVGGKQSRATGFLAQFQPTQYPYGTASASWELPLFGKGEGAFALRGAQVASADEQVRSSQVSLVADLHQVYARALAAKRKEPAFANNVALARDEFEATSRAFKQASVTLSDRNVAFQKLASARDKERANATDLLSATAAIRALVDQPSLTLELEEDLPVLNAGSPPQPEWMRGRPDVRGAEAAVGQAAAAVGIARAELVPQLSLGGVLSKAPGVLHTATQTATLALPLLDWFAAAKNVDAKKHDMQAAVYDYRDTLNQAWREAAVSYHEVVADEARLEELRLLAANADEEFAKAGRGFQLGVLSKAALWKLEVAKNDVEAESLDARAALHTAWAKHRKAVYGH